MTKHHTNLVKRLWLAATVMTYALGGWAAPAEAQDPSLPSAPDQLTVGPKVECGPEAASSEVILEGALAQSTLDVQGVSKACKTAETQCSDAKTVCVTALAVPTVSCSTNWVIIKQCTAVGTPGGHGVSPTELSGTMSWQGSACGGKGMGECGNPQSSSGGCSWPKDDEDGCASSRGLTIGTWTCLKPCKTSGYVDVSSKASAESYADNPLGGSTLVESVAAEWSAWEYREL